MTVTTGKLLVISGPSGAGKTSVVKALRTLPRVEFSVSATTRRMRDGEVDGTDYHFLSREEFERRREAGAFLEWAEYNGNLYGTERARMEAALAEGRVYVLEIEVQGTRQLRAGAVDGLYVFIEPPSLEELRRRLEVRGQESAEEIDGRLRIAAQELEARDLYDHHIVNRDLDETIRRVVALVEASPAPS